MVYLGRMRSVAVNWERRDRYSNYEGPTPDTTLGTASAVNPLNAVWAHFNIYIFFTPLFHAS